MKIKDLGNGNYQEYPDDSTEEGLIEVDDIDTWVYEHLPLDAKRYWRYRDLKKFLADTDYKVFKYAEGLLTDEEYASIKAQRQAWRDEINELEELMNNEGDDSA